jgi:tRNA nucleotidyltransferase (CCA-adding enzyme)
MNISNKVNQILKTLNDNGFNAFVVGGCVRDTLMDIEPNDWDITTNALPEQVINLFSKTLTVGIKHGTVVVVIDNEDFEITTFRIDGESSDCRRPDIVKFSTSIKEDLARRDFTVNAIAFNFKDGFIDPFNGTIDIKNKIIRAVGDPDKRFSEDALRMLRAIRFSAQKNFNIDSKTFEAIKNNRNLILKISPERIRDELEKIIISNNSDEFELLHETGLLDLILPEISKLFSTEQNNPHHIFNVATHTLKALSNIEKDRILKWAILFHDIGKAETKTIDIDGADHFFGHAKISKDIAINIMRRLHFDNASIDQISELIEIHDLDIDTTEKAVRRVLSKLGVEKFRNLLKIQKADKLAQNPKFLKSKIDKISTVEKILDNEIDKGNCVGLKLLKINGNDLIKLGLKGKQIGDMLNQLLEIIIDDPAKNEKNILTKICKIKCK